VIEKMNLTVKDGEMLALLGPSGCGKSTTLFAICGIHRMDEGRLLFDGRDVTATTSQDRGVGVVFQSYALYPHMNVAENIGFPLKVRRESREDIRRKVAEMADLVQIGPYLDRRPAELSGGQQQRVALARALIRRPQVLLLDEPLANLDAKLRLEMRSEIRRIQQETGITAILVTHDQVEAMSMCDRIAIMREGRIVQTAPPAEMYRDPVDDFVAGFLGNPPIAFLEGRLEGGAFRAGETEIPIPGLPEDTDGPARLGVRPEHFQPGAGAPVTGTVSFIETQGREILYDVTLPGGGILRSIQSADAPQATMGEVVGWGVDTGKALLFDAQGKRIRTD
ncbi:MAG: ABC transporter ATP-binding protein, partial [Alphaproteobacteria bacterium]